ncbi:MAG: extracellular solute-binding protein [Holosporales bacterium]|nr:extracellular solute-binding protein [Holosporales bacterium]
MRFLTLFVLCPVFIFTLNWIRIHWISENVVHVYGWYGIIPRTIISKFKEETGIDIVYDIFDNNDILEAKLLAKSSGYDVVFPSFIPYAARQLAMGAYQKFDLNLLPNLRNIDGILTEKFEQNGGNRNYLVPLFWGTIGIAYEKNVIAKILPGVEIDYNTLFAPKKLKKLFHYGVSFPDEYVDIFPQIKAHLYKDAKKEDLVSDVYEYCRYLSRIRPFITKFSSSTITADLLSGDACIAIGSSDTSWRAMKIAKEVNKEIVYVIPKEGGILWLDCIGIPQNAPHKENAHKLINFLLRPEIAAQITNHSGILVNVSNARDFIKKEIIDEDQVYPTDPNVLVRLKLGHSSKNTEEMKYEKVAAREWARFKMNAYLG